MTNLLNPKVLLFMIAFLPQFTTPDNGPVWIQMLVLGVTMKALSLPYGSCFAYGASRIRGWVGRNPWFLRMQQGLLGAIMLALALYVLYSTASTLTPDFSRRRSTMTAATLPSGRDASASTLMPTLSLIGAMASLCIGTSFAKSLFPDVGAQGTTAYRIVIGAIILIAFWRPWRFP